MNTLEMFPLEDYLDNSLQHIGEEIEGGAEDCSEIDRIDHHAGTDGDQQSDGCAIPGQTEQFPAQSQRQAVDTGKQVAVERPAWPYESTGLTGRFELNPLALYFPYGPEADIRALARDIEVNGLVDEVTVAGDPPMVVDGKRRLKACDIAGVQPTFRLLNPEFDPRNYSWTRNGERRQLTPSQKALAFVQLFPPRDPGRPPSREQNCSESDNFAQPTQGQGAQALGISRGLINAAGKVADKGGPVVEEVREAVREGTVTVSDAVTKNVMDAPPEVQRQALALVGGGEARTLNAAVEKLLLETPGPEIEQVSEPPQPTTSGEHLTFYCSSVADLGKWVEPGTVDLIVAPPLAGSPPRLLSGLVRQSAHLLTEDGATVVPVADTGHLPDILPRLQGHGLEWAMEFSLLFPTAVTTSGEPHWVDIRRVALLVLAKPSARLREGPDVIEVPFPEGDIPGRPPCVEDGIALVVPRFAIEGQVVCLPDLQGMESAALRIISAGYSLIGAAEDQEIIDRIIAETE